MQDVLFAFELTDSELQEPKLHPDTLKTEPELLETRSARRRASQYKVKIRRAA
jgi:hypothetical protein